MAAASNKLTVSFDFERETKGAVRFQETGVKAGTEPVIGTLYLRKTHLGGTTPKGVKLTVELS